MDCSPFSDCWSSLRWQLEESEKVYTAKGISLKIPERTLFLNIKKKFDPVLINVYAVIEESCFRILDGPGERVTDYFNCEAKKKYRIIKNENKNKNNNVVSNRPAAVLRSKL